MPATPEGGCNFPGGGAALPPNPKKGGNDKRTIINLYCPSDALTVEKNMHERMNRKEP